MGKETFHVFPPSVKKVSSTLIKKDAHLWQREDMDALAKELNTGWLAKRTSFLSGIIWKC
jgi:hypothetical protein